MTDSQAATPEARREPVRMCNRCIMDGSVPGVFFDDRGICSHCAIHDKLDAMYPTGEAGEQELRKISRRVTRAGRRRKYDCVVGVSGGRDTTYCLWKTKELGLRPLAVHFDNGWDSEIAKSNLRKACDRLDVDLHTIIADWDESRELTNCTIRASVPYIDLTDDVGIASALYRTASAEGIRYIILSHSFREEGITPLKWMYIDGRYVRSLIRRFATKKLRHFKNVDVHHMLYWMFVKRIKVVNLTNHYDDTGRKIEELLKQELDWIDTGQHHYDNEIFALVYYYARHKFGFDWRVVELSAKVRSGAVTRDVALATMQEVPFFEDLDRVKYCLKKQGIAPEEWDRIMKAPRKYFYDYPTWYPLLKLAKHPIKLLGRLNILPGHVYEKFFET